MKYKKIIQCHAEFISASLSIFIILMVVFLLPIKIFAQEGSTTQGLTISPPINEKTIAPGDSWSDVIKITNPTDNDLEIGISKKDFITLGEEGGQQFIEPEENDSNYSLAKWIQVESEFDLAPKEMREIKFSIKVPENAEPGGHYGVIVFTPTIKQDSGNPAGSAVLAIPQIGSLFLIKVEGKMNLQGKIAEFTTNKKLYSYNPVEFITRLQNSGNIHFKPTGNITIKNAFGKQVANFIVNEKLGNVLPDSIRKFTNEWTYGRRFGWYRANVNLNYGGSTPVQASLLFFIIPWKETVGAILVLIVLIWILRKFKLEKK